MANDADFLPVVAPSKEERTWAMLCHLFVAGYIFLPFMPIMPTLIFGTLLIWSLKGEQMPFVKTHGKEVLNFQITQFLAAIICWVLLFFFGLGWLLAWLLGIYSFVVGIIGAVKANEGKPYRYAINLRLIS